MASYLVSLRILNTLRNIMVGGTYIRPSAEDYIAGNSSRGDISRPSHTSPSDREFEVLGLMAPGNTVMHL
jgi:DNA-binding NarL/FixJ family response regulator